MKVALNTINQPTNLFSGMRIPFRFDMLLFYCLHDCIISLRVLGHKSRLTQGFQSGPVPGTFTRLRSCIVPAEITEPPKISGGQNHKYDGR